MHGAATRAHLGVRQLAVHVGQEADHGRVGGDADLLQRLQPGPQRAGHEELQQALVAERERWRETEDPTAAHPPPNSDGRGLKDPPPKSQGVINGGGRWQRTHPFKQTTNTVAIARLRREGSAVLDVLVDLTGRSSKDGSGWYLTKPKRPNHLGWTSPAKLLRQEKYHLPTIFISVI